MPENQMKPITYISEHGKEYSDELGKCESLAQLVAHTVKWKPLARDAYEIVRDMNYTDWGEFERGWKKERKGKYAGDEWAAKYAAILMPEIIFRVSMVAAQFHVPWGLAFVRLKEEKFIRKYKGAYMWSNKQPGDSIGKADRSQPE